MSHKVIIRGHVFDYAEKAPFVPSGQSVLGAIEYDEEAERVKCHECGEWFSSIGKHCFHIHEIPAVNYKVKHGLQQSTPLDCPAITVRSKVNKGCSDIRLLGKAQQCRNRQKSKPISTARLEQRNLKSSCDAQLLFRIQMTAAVLGRTPTYIELQDAGIFPQRLRNQFGTVAHAIELACLSLPSGRGSNFKHGPLPVGFPTKAQLLETRMPVAEGILWCRTGCRQ